MLADNFLNLIVLELGCGNGRMSEFIGKNCKKLYAIDVSKLKNYFDIVEYYKALDLYIVSSRAEGGLKAILEAMACGVALVTTNVGRVNDIIRDGINGFIVNGDDTVSELIDLSRKVIMDVDKKDNEIYSKLME